MQIKHMRAISTLSLLALGTVAMNCGEMPTDGSETVVSPLQGQLQTAFQRSDNKLVVSTGVNTGTPSTFVMWGGTRPTQVPSGSGLNIAIQKSTNNIFGIINFSNGLFTEPVPSSLRIWGGTSPQIAQCPACPSYSFAFLNANGHMYAGTGSPANAVDTTAPMWGGTNPSIGMKSNGTSVFAYLNANGHLYVGENGISAGNPGTDTGKLMWGGTSPSIAVGGSPEREAVVMLGSNGRLWYGSSGASVSDTGENMWGGTSPSVTVTPDGSVFVAFRNQNGILKILKNTVGAGNTTWLPFIAGGGLAVNGSPNIYPVGSSGYQVVFKASNGHLAIDLNTSGVSNSDVAQDQGWAMN
jgi:hypothetical protein